MNTDPTAQLNSWRRPNRLRKGLMIGGAVVVLLGAGVAAGGKQEPAKSTATPLATAPATSVVTREEVATTEAPVVTEAPTAIPPATIPPVTYAVAGVVDGDTVDIVASDGRAFRVRVIGIDAPETGTCEGAAGTEAMFWLVQGKQVALSEGGDGEDTDRYGRYLRYVDVDGVDAGLSMIQSGHAIARYDSRDGYGLHDREADYVAADATSPDFTCPQPAAQSQPAVESPVVQPATAFYANCDAVRAAGAAPIHAGDPGWQQKFDGDKDGVGCE